MSSERVVRCGLSPDTGKGRGQLALEIDGRQHSASLRIDRLASRLLANLPDYLIDLLEVAAYVYMADAAVPRGGPTDRQMGAHWRRRFRFEIPVREPDLWNGDDVRQALVETLTLLSDDNYDFRFIPHEAAPIGQRYFQLPVESAFAADEALMFSGGLDSLAGALDALLSRNHRVVLVSHHSAGTMHRVQKDLVRDMERIVGPNRLLHVPVSLQIGAGGNRESTHRTRSLFFAALGVATAHMFNIDRLRFYENGVISLNLPPASQVVGSRATRSTHPQALAGFGRLFSAIFGRDIRVDNPFIWKTKTEIVETIRDLGAKGMIRYARSCGEVRRMSNMHPHCGLCSQCVDRRFAVLAAGLEQEDPAAAYAVDPLGGERTGVREREIALGYANNARQFAIMSPADFAGSFGEIQRAVGFMNVPPDAAAKRIYRLHKRHGRSVSNVIDKALSRVHASDRTSGTEFHPSSLIMLTGRAIYGGDAPEAPIEPSSQPPRPLSATPTTRWLVQLRPELNDVTIGGVGELNGVAATVLWAFAKRHLEAAGKGLASEGYPLVGAHELTLEWGLISDANVRKRISRVRTAIRHLVTEKGLQAPDNDGIIENVGWKGYRLNPDTVQVIIVSAR